jgi:hypothetical protein
LNANSYEIVPKQKSPKKKVFSVTRLVIENYQSPTTKPTATGQTSGFFTPPAKIKSRSISSDKSIPKKNPLPSKNSRIRAPRNKRTDSIKESVQPKKPAAAIKAKKAAIVKPKLLSPTQAAQKLGRQDLLFGTSSQLRKEDSPEQLRQLQQVLHESNISAAKDQGTLPYLTFRTSGAVSRSDGGLWQEAAATDTDDTVSPVLSIGTPPTLESVDELSNLMGVDISTGPDLQATETLRETMVDRVTGYEFTSNDEPAVEFNYNGSGTRTELPEDDKSSEEWACIDDFSPVRTRDGKHDPQSFNIPSTAGGFVAAKEDHKRPLNASKMPDVPSTLTTQSRSDSSQSVTTNRPALRALSTNTKRFIDTVNDRLDKTSTVEEQVTRTAIGQANIHQQKQSVLEQGPLPEKRPRGRPRITRRLEVASALTMSPTTAKLADEAEGIWHHIDDIEDSELDLTPSPPRRRGRPSNDCASQLPKLTISETVNKRVNTFMASGTHPDWAVIQPSLFKEITDTVKAAPPSTDIHKPSWAEKIALYDPIVIEDLTAWLNGDKQLRVRVKQREDELQGWMVQKWCEEKSVCCLWREGLWGGVKKKY